MANTHHTGIPKLQWSFEYPPCTPSVTIVADKNPFCAGYSVTFTPTFNCVEDITITAYAWVVNGVIKSTSPDPFITTELLNNDKVYFFFIANENPYFSNVITVVEKTEGCEEPITEVKYGLLYNWYAATDERNITSSDTWRVTESADWKALLLALGGIDQGSTVWSELPDEFGQFPLNNHYPLCDSDSQYWDTFVGTNTLNFNFRGSGRRLVIYDEETETINTYFDNKGIYGYSLCSDTSSGNELFIFMWERYSILFFSTYATSPTAKKTGYSIRLVRPATAEELLLSDGTACDPYTGNDGKSYRTVKLLGLVWIADNLAETKFRNGDLIPEVTDNAAWAALTTGALCAYNNDWNNV